MRIRLRPVIRDAEAEIFVRIGFLRVDLAEQTLGAVDLVDLLFAGSETDLLVAQLTQNRVQIVGVHHDSSSSEELGLFSLATPCANSSPDPKNSVLSPRGLILSRFRPKRKAL